MKSNHRIARRLAGFALLVFGMAHLIFGYFHFGSLKPEAMWFYSTGFWLLAIGLLVQAATAEKANRPIEAVLLFNNLGMALIAIGLLASEFALHIAIILAFCVLLSISNMFVISSTLDAQPVLRRL